MLWAEHVAKNTARERDDVAAAVRASRFGREIWATLMVIALCALFLEALLARWFVRKMTDSRDVEISSRGITRRTRAAAAEGA